jgi:hypothetical protein
MSLFCYMPYSLLSIKSLKEGTIFSTLTWTLAKGIKKKKIIKFFFQVARAWGAMGARDYGGAI